MSKALVITRAIQDLTDSQKQLLQETDTFKIAVNWAQINNPNYRLFHDFGNYKWYCDNYPNDKLITPIIAKKLIDKRDKSSHFHFFYHCCNEPNTSRQEELYMYNASIIPTVDYCIKLGYTDILLIARNDVHAKHFQKGVNHAIDKLSKHARIYQYTNGNFNLETLSIENFLSKDFIN